VLVGSLTVYGHKNKCRINQKGEGWTSKIEVMEALIEHADYSYLVFAKAKKKRRKGGGAVG
jgi:hypothetical protein